MEKTYKKLNMRQTKLGQDTIGVVLNVPVYDGGWLDNDRYFVADIFINDTLIIRHHDWKDELFDSDFSGTKLLENMGINNVVSNLLNSHDFINEEIINSEDNDELTKEYVNNLINYSNYDKEFSNVLFVDSFDDFTNSKYYVNKERFVKLSKIDVVYLLNTDTLVYVFYDENNNIIDDIKEGNDIILPEGTLLKRYLDAKTNVFNPLRLSVRDFVLLKDWYSNVSSDYSYSISELLHKKGLELLGKVKDNHKDEYEEYDYIWGINEFDDEYIRDDEIVNRARKAFNKIYPEYERYLKIGFRLDYITRVETTDGKELFVTALDSFDNLEMYPEILVTTDGRVLIMSSSNMNNILSETDFHSDAFIDLRAFKNMYYFNENDSHRYYIDINNVCLKPELLNEIIDNVDLPSDVDLNANDIVNTFTQLLKKEIKKYNTMKDYTK